MVRRRDPKGTRGSSTTRELDTPAAGGSPRSQAWSASGGSGQRAAKDARRRRIACSTSDDQRQAITWVTLRQGHREVTALGVVRTGGLLEVRELGPVLDVEQVLQVPAEQVGTSGELVVLVGLVDGHRAPGSRERPGFDLAHGRVDEVPGLMGGGYAAITATGGVTAHIGQVEGRPQAQRRREPRVGLERQDATRLHVMRHAEADASASREIAEGPTAAQALGADPQAGLQRQAREGRPGGRRHGIAASDR